MLDSDNLQNVGPVYGIITAGNAIWVPAQLLCQVVFYAKYFTIFWTDDKRDNRMIYFLAENKRYKKIHCSMFIYLSIKLSLVAIYTYAAYKYTLDYVYSDFIKKYHNSGFFVWQVVKFTFFYIPRSLHGIVIFLYCLEWKFRVRYFWKCKFIEYLHDASLLKHYKKMMNLMEYQLFWIKGWMVGDLLSITIGTWYWLWVWFQYHSTDSDTSIAILVIEGLGFTLYHSMGFILTWLTAASITTEADDLYKCAFQILEKLNEQHFTQCFKSDGWDVENNEKLVDYHQIDFNESSDKQNIITGLYHRKSMSTKNRKSTKSSVNNDNDAEDYEESWKALINNKNIIWEEWIYMNNVDVNNIKDEMKRSCLIKQLQTFILYYNEHPCVFTLGLTIRYATLFKVVLFFACAKLADYLWGFTSITDS